jgi:TfoX/Sxy family transcriptional regulator of competence genes
VAYDEKIAGMIRAEIAAVTSVTEKKMFGGLAFLVGGNMAVAASGQGGLLVRVDPERSDAIVSTTAAEPMVMRGREMAGWLRVDASHAKTASQVRKWVDLGVAYAGSLPAKG